MKIMILTFFVGVKYSLQCMEVQRNPMANSIIYQKIIFTAKGQGLILGPEIRFWKLVQPPKKQIKITNIEC